MLRQVGRSAVVLALALLPGTRPAGAQEFDDFPDDPSSFTTVIDARDYDDRFETVEDLLRRVPGVRVQRSGGLGTFSTASIRASKPEQVVVLLDGVRLNSGQRGAVDLSTIPVRSIERIEIVRGGGSARYGSGAVGGVISITSRLPRKEPHVDFSGMSGRYGTLGGDATVTGGTERVRGLLSYDRLRSDNDFRFERSFDNVDLGRRRTPPAARFTRLNSGFLEQTTLGRVFLDTTPSSDVTATVRFHQNDRGQPGSIFRRPIRPDDVDETVSCALPEEKYKRGLFQIDGVHSALGPVSVETSAYWRYDKTQLDDPGGLCFNPFNPERAHIEGVDAQAGGEIRLATRYVPLGAVTTRHRFSASLRNDRLRSDDTPSASRWVANLFALQELRFLQGRVRLFPALGLELADSDSVETRSPGLGGTVSTTADDDPEWIPQAGAIIRVAPGLRLKGNWGRAYRRPNFNELYFPDLGFIRGNPFLEPEDAWNWDFGLEYASEGAGVLENVRFEAAWFESRIEDSIEWIDVSAFTFAPQNVGKAKKRGAELSLGATLWNRLNLSGSYTFVDSEIDTPITGPFDARDPPLPHQPRSHFFGHADLQLGPFDVWAEVDVEDDVYLVTNKGYHAEGSTLVDFGVSVALDALPGLRRLPGGLVLSSEWMNVTNAERFDSLGFPLPGPLWYLRLRGFADLGGRID